MPSGSPGIKVIKEEIAYWETMGDLLGWKLYGWDGKKSASFLIKGNWGTTDIVRISGVERERLMARFAHILPFVNFLP